MHASIEKARIRTIEKRDNTTLAYIIRSTLKEFGANHPGTVYYDATTDDLYALFDGKEGAIYYVAEMEGKVVGGGGIYPTDGLPSDTCELVKMYLLPEARGIGLGTLMIQTCIAFAKTAGYKNIYLETMPELKKALTTYEKLGFHYINQPMGNSGHFGCDLWMAMSIG